MMSKILKSFLFITILIIFYYTFAQYAIYNGVGLPANDTIRVFIVFVEVDYTDGPCPKNLPEPGYGTEETWPKIPVPSTKDEVSLKDEPTTKNYKTQIPLFADDFFDYEIKKGEQPKGYITDYYHQASFGQYVLLGDYYPEVITIPCKIIRLGDNGMNYVLKYLNNEKPDDTTLYSFHGLPLNAFDKWTPTNQGLPKVKKPDGKIDLLYIIWRNNRFISFDANAKDFSGYGVSMTVGLPFKNMKGVNNVASFNTGGAAEGAYTVTIGEHMHAIFGGNHWHTAGGRGNHTFLAIPHNYGLTGQYAATMQAVCAWDRWMMNWKNPAKKFLISAYDEQGNEINTESFSIDSHPQGGTFILNDFITTGDAIQIKLPHIKSADGRVGWQKQGDVKNQYLWIENRIMSPHSRIDKYYTEDCADNNNGKFPYGTPGLYMYIQVGKDLKEGDSDIYSSNTAHPNGLASFLYPLSAEGNYDFYYCFDNIQSPNSGLCGNWGNANIPIDKKLSLPNPFTGFSDLFNTLDFNKDGKLLSGDTIQLGLSEIINDSVVHNYNRSGDWEDAFCKATKKVKLSISTNPAPVPVYTYTTNFEGHRFFLDKNNQPQSYENRTIWLNGLSIEILSENDDGSIKLKIRWDVYTVENNVRWCGNIILSPNDFDKGKPSLIVKKGKKILLDRGRSPTKHLATEKDKNGEWLFTDTTQFTCLENSFLYLEPKSAIIIDNGSKLILERGSKIYIGKKAKIKLKNGGKLVNDGAEIICHKKGKICW